MAILLGISLWNSFRPSGRGPREPIRVSVTVPQTARLQDSDHSLAISPDGRRLALALSEKETTRLYLRDLSRDEMVPLPGTEGGERPFFSPDGRWVAYRDDDDSKLKKVSIEGGSPIEICADVGWGGGSWGSDGFIVYTRDQYSGLWRVPDSSGAPEMLSKRDAAAGELGHWWPQILPGGRHVLFTSYRAPVSEARIMMHSLETGERRVLVESAFFGRYVPTGHLIFARGTTLFAVSFDLSRFEMTGSPIPVLDDVACSAPSGFSQFDVSEGGTLAYLSDSVLNPPQDLVWVDRDGSGQPVGLEARLYENPRISPDGRRLAVTVTGDSEDIWVYELSRGTPTRLTFEAGTEWYPVWAADGRRVFYAKERPQWDLFWRAVDAGGEEELLHSNGYDKVPTSLSPDGTVLAYVETHPDTREDIWLLALDGEREKIPFLRTPFDDNLPAFSPDGRWLAYQSNESGRTEVYVQAYPGPGGKVQISLDGGTEAAWSRDGREIFFRRGGTMMSVSVETAGGIRAGRPRALFERQYEKFSEDPTYDVSGDGRFLMVQTPEALVPRRVETVLNFHEEIKRKFAEAQ
jgi:serine/threonine-protein kinase